MLSCDVYREIGPVNGHRMRCSLSKYGACYRVGMGKTNRATRFEGNVNSGSVPALWPFQSNTFAGPMGLDFSETQRRGRRMFLAAEPAPDLMFCDGTGRSLEQPRYPTQGNMYFTKPARATTANGKSRELTSCLRQAHGNYLPQQITPQRPYLVQVAFHCLVRAPGPSQTPPPPLGFC